MSEDEFLNLADGLTPEQRKILDSLSPEEREERRKDMDAANYLVKAKQQELRQKKLEETTIWFNNAQITFLEKQTAALAEQSTYTRAIKTWAMWTAIATIVIAISTVAQWQCSKASKSEQKISPACQKLEPNTYQSPIK